MTPRVVSFGAMHNTRRRRHPAPPRFASAGFAGIGDMTGELLGPNPTWRGKWPTRSAPLFLTPIEPTYMP